jgi:hypothetical protein
MVLVNFQKKNLDSFPSIFLLEFRCLNISAVTEQIFWRAIPKFLFQDGHFDPIRWVPRQFFKILINPNPHRVG